MSVQTTIKTGSMLLAEPFMLDPHFRRSAVLICEHTDVGTLGFILNKVVNIQLEDLFDEFPSFEAPIFYGGPVQTDTLHYIHNVGDLLEDSMKVSDGIWWGGDFEKLKFLISAQLIQPQNIRFFVGYAGWSSGQLRDEITEGSWVMSDVHANYAFKMEPKEVWSKAMYDKGNVYEILASLPDEEAWN
jgi:putative transcriptional regulator